MAWETIGPDVPLTVNIEVFEGPLDLLLHLIKKNEMDIADIPISLITRQYLEYLELMRSLDLSVAGEYLEMAATLLFIKSRMLVPRPEDQLDGDDPQEEDPREMLKRPLEALLEIRRLASCLMERPILGRDVFTRGKIDDLRHGPQDVSLKDVTLYDLLRSYMEAMDRRRRRTPLTLGAREFKIEKEVERIKGLLRRSPQVSFFDLLGRAEKFYIVTVFIAVLELARNGLVKLVQGHIDGELIVVSAA